MYKSSKLQTEQNKIYWNVLLKLREEDLATTLRQLCILMWCFSNLKFDDALELFGKMGVLIYKTK